jgi:FMN hydrolase / 5-amino-6-(5-phospho-D-ribitylamino)uracil phosphatase
MNRTLISIDVGGTLGEATTPSLAATLADMSPLGARRAREIMRDRLHTAPAITETVEQEVCAALRIPISSFPNQVVPPALRLAPGALRVLYELSTLGVVVTLSNVTCLEADTDTLRRRLNPWVDDHFPSCRTGYSKPDPRAFLTAAARHNAPASRVVPIGDDWDCDIVGATGIGAAAIWISHGRSVPDQRWLDSNRLLVADDLAAVVPHVRSLLARRSA